MGMGAFDVLHRLAFLGFSLAVTMSLEQLVNHLARDLRAVLLMETFFDFVLGQVSPAYLGVHWIAGGKIAQHIEKLLVDIRVPLVIGFAPGTSSALPLIGFIFRQLVEFGHAFVDRFPATTQDAGDVGDATIAELASFDASIAAFVFLGERVVECSHLLFDGDGVGSHRAQLDKVRELTRTRK